LKCGRGENVLCRASWRKRTANKIFAVRFFRAHGKELICRAFFLCRALYKKRTANKLCAVRPKKNARQRLWRTANTGFPVVINGYTKQEYEKLTKGNLRDLVEDVHELLGDGDGGSRHLGDLRPPAAWRVRRLQQVAIIRHRCTRRLTPRDLPLNQG
jgi:hypothetical protein